MLSALLVISVLLVAFTNGANANFKGVASLYGSDTLSRRQAIWWGSLTTLVGSLASMLLATSILKQFGGKGIVPDSLAGEQNFLTAVALGAAFTSFLATRFGFPVSTTHALVGALVGAGLVGNSSEVNFTGLFKTVINPLLFSPAVAIVGGAVMYIILRSLRLAPDHRTRSLDAFHFLSTGAASLARGLNDTPKMVALLVGVPGLELWWAFIMVSIVILIGGLLDADRVAETLGKRVTSMNPGQGFAASLVTAMLVTTASFWSLPVSTTHVSVGSLVGIGVTTKRIFWRKVGDIVFAWISTVPCGAIIAAFAFILIRQIS